MKNDPIEYVKNLELPPPIKREKNNMGGLMQGWKTWTGAIVLMATGLAKVVGAVSNFPDVDSAALKEGIELIGGGLVVVGLGHKIEKSGIVNVKQ